jgi:hypothetical protein
MFERTRNLMLIDTNFHFSILWLNSRDLHRSTAGHLVETSRTCLSLIL